MRRRVRHDGLAAVLLSASAIVVAEPAPDFGAVFEVEPETVAPGKFMGLVRNIGGWTVRNVVLRVRHRWSWGGGDYQHTDRATVTRLVLSGEPAGFASVHIPPPHVPAGARYSNDVTIMQLSEIRLDEE